MGLCSLCGGTGYSSSPSVALLAPQFSCPLSHWVGTWGPQRMTKLPQAPESLCEPLIENRPSERTSALTVCGSGNRGCVWVIDSKAEAWAPRGPDSDSASPWKPEAGGQRVQWRIARGGRREGWTRGAGAARPGSGPSSPSSISIEPGSAWGWPRLRGPRLFTSSGIDP